MDNKLNFLSFSSKNATMLSSNTTCVSTIQNNQNWKIDDSLDCLLLGFLRVINSGTFVVQNSGTFVVQK